VRLLLDTHTLLWLQSGDPQLSAKAKTLLTDPSNERFLSMASAWEIAIKSGLKKLTLADPFPALLAKVVLAYQIVLLTIAVDDCAAYEQLSFPNPNHRDPFDRMILVHALRNGLSLVSADAAFDAYGVARCW
jgi:PIN domain nuclease of toxin-antitoxin system